ncbi:ribosome biogenesis GTPase Der [Candidatus Dependentiae bacterium]|nr:ribosome biogenesis GTPase Der [Candidatus Dependentiae bacterium]
MDVTTSHPKVLIVGRTNVGKSTLFNRLAENRRSIVFDREGVTRDYIEEVVTWQDRPFTLIDTGGMSFVKGTDEITKRVQEKVIRLLNQASILLFVVDGKNGLQLEDEKIADVVRRANKPTFLLVNKADNLRAMDDNITEFYGLGFSNLIPISAVHGTGISVLLKNIVDTLPTDHQGETLKPVYNVALIGRPNVGKSSLMNLLLQHERSIVSDVAGTTREPITAMTYNLNDLIQFTDTAGVRRPRKVEDDLEGLMVKSSLIAVKNADIIIMMIDASEGKIADQELKLLFYAYEQHKMIVVVFNKTDLLTEYTKYTLEQSIEEYKFILKKVPQIWISCLTQKNVSKIFNEVQQVWRRCHQEFNPVEVDELVKTEMLNKFLVHNTAPLRISAVVPIGTNMPTFVLEVNHPQFFGPSELGCVENILRKHYDLLGCPVRLFPRKD